MDPYLKQAKAQKIGLEQRFLLDHNWSCSQWSRKADNSVDDVLCDILNRIDHIRPVVCKISIVFGSLLSHLSCRLGKT